MTVYLDDDPENADWTKQTWDLLHVTNVDELRAYLLFVGWRAVDFAESSTYKTGLKTQEWLEDATKQLIAEGVGVSPP